MKKLYIFLLLLISINTFSHQYNEEVDYTISLLPSYQAAINFDHKSAVCNANHYSNLHKYSKNRVTLDAVQSFNYTSEQLHYYFQYHGYSEKEILSQYHLYQFDEFIKLAKTYAGYVPTIERLHKKFKNIGVLKKIGYAFAGAYSPGLKKRINQLYDEINVARIFLSDSVITESDKLHTVYSQYSPLLATAVERRIKAYHEIKSGNACSVTRTYTFTTGVASLLHSSGYALEDFDHCTGNQLQQLIHSEALSILRHINDLPQHSILYAHQNALIDCTSSMCDYNQAGLLDKATQVADFCWTLLDYGQAILEGAVIGVSSGIQDILTNPLEATACIIAGKQVLVYQLCKVLYNVADIGITAFHDCDQAKEKWDDYIAPITEIITAIKDKETSIRDVLRTGSALVVGYKAQAKLLGGLGKFFTKVRCKAINFAKNNSLLTPDYYATTPEGIILKASHDAERIGVANQGVSTSLLLLETAYARVAAELKKDIEFLQKKYNCRRSGMIDFAHKKIKMNYEHVLGMEINLTKKGKLSIGGFHHDFNNVIEKSGILEFSNKTLDRYGCYKVRILDKGERIKEITFFPSQWDREKVIGKIYEAYDNFKNKGSNPELQRDGKYLIKSATNEGLDVAIFITKNGQITTAYPLVN